MCARDCWAWSARTGRKGSTLITEDVCFPPERLAQGAHDVQQLLAKHGFIPGVAGHAAHGNLHFVLVADFGNAEDLARYSAFMAELVDLVVQKYDGSLKAEHGTGLNMAPFVAAEWGEKAAAMMWRIKQLADPHGILAPNVILTRNQNLHLENLKVGPADRGHHRQLALHRVRLLRTGLPEPQCDDDAATTDRAPARNGQADAGLTHARPIAGGVSIRRDRDLRRRRNVRHSLSDRDQYRCLDQGIQSARE